VQGAVERQADRLAQAHGKGRLIGRAALRSLSVHDVVGDRLPDPKHSGEALDDLVGLEEVKGKLREYQAIIQSAKARGEDPRDYFEPAFVFLGNPGVGKTTVARKMGGIFHKLGFLASDEVVEVDAHALIAQFQGQTAKLTTDILESALGKTLFIDEAYTLADRSNPYNQQAIDTLMKFASDHRGKLAIILAGYHDDMQHFLDANPGVRRRFSEVVNFEDFSTEQSVTLFKQLAAGKRFTLDKSAQRAMPELMDRLRRAPAWSNAGDVETFFIKTVRKQSLRQIGSTVLTAHDLEEGLKELLRNKPSAAPQEHAARTFDPKSMATRQDAEAQPPAISARQAKASAHHADTEAGAAPHVHTERQQQMMSAFEEATVQHQLTEQDLKSAAATGQWSPAMIDSMANKLGLSTEEEKQQMVADLQRTVTRGNQEAELAKKTHTKEAKAEWVCSRCFNSNPFCPYRPKREGGFLRPLL